MSYWHAKKYDLCKFLTTIGAIENTDNPFVLMLVYTTAGEEHMTQHQLTILRPTHPPHSIEELNHKVLETLAMMNDLDARALVVVSPNSSEKSTCIFFDARVNYPTDDTKTDFNSTIFSLSALEEAFDVFIQEPVGIAQSVPGKAILLLQAREAPSR